MARFLNKLPDPATLDSLADFICGDNAEKYPEYRSSSYLTRFFANVNVEVVHDGSTRKWWVLDVLKHLPLQHLEMVILRLVDIREYKGDRSKLQLAAKAMNDILFMENMSVTFVGRDPVLAPLKDDQEPIIQKDESGSTGITETDFLKKDFEINDVVKLSLDSSIEITLKERIREARECVLHGAYLSSVIMSGSTLEGILLGVAIKSPRSFQSAAASPKDKSGKALPIQDWKLASLIDVTYELKLIGLDVKKFSHALRDFRNYIHPFEQYSTGFEPDEHTAKISLQVLNATIADLIRTTRT